MTCARELLSRIMLESFVSTQKFSVQKALRRKFRRFIVAKTDFTELTLLKLQECLRNISKAEHTNEDRDEEYHRVKCR